MSYHDRINRVAAYAEEAGLSLVTVGNLVASNARLFERTKRRIEQVEADLERLEAFIDARSMTKQDGTASASVQGAAK